MPRTKLFVFLLVFQIKTQEAIKFAMAGFG